MRRICKLPVHNFQFFFAQNSDNPPDDGLLQFHSADNVRHLATTAGDEKLAE